MEFQLDELLKKILGNIGVYGEQNHDNTTCENLENYREALSILIEKVGCIVKYKNSPLSSEKICGQKAYKLLENISEDIKYYLEEEN